MKDIGTSVQSVIAQFVDVRSAQYKTTRGCEEVWVDGKVTFLVKGCSVEKLDQVFIFVECYLEEVMNEHSTSTPGSRFGSRLSWFKILPAQNPRCVANVSSQVHRFTSSQVGSQVHKFTGSQVHRFTSSQVHKFTSSQVHRFTSSQVHKFTSP
jgi:hypothetical protein